MVCLSEFDFLIRLQIICDVYISKLTGLHPLR